jgi:hypothetical protein
MADLPDDVGFRDVVDRETALRIVAFSLIAIAAFVVVGVYAPQLYFQYDDPDHLYDVEEFAVENATTDAEALNVTVVRTVSHSARGSINIDLKLLRTQNNRTTERELKSMSIPANYETGTEVADFRFPVGDVRLRPGQYVLTGVVEMNFENGVTRHITVRSQTFSIREPVNETSEQAQS